MKVLCSSHIRSTLIAYIISFLIPLCLSWPITQFILNIISNWPYLPCLVEDLDESERHGNETEHQIRHS